LKYLTCYVSLFPLFLKNQVSNQVLDPFDPNPQTVALITNLHFSTFTKILASMDHFLYHLYRHKLVLHWHLIKIYNFVAQFHFISAFFLSCFIDWWQNSHTYSGIIKYPSRIIFPRSDNLNIVVFEVT
jgi:hypothetical protein